jgi:type I restriction enzyme M protein
MPTTTHDIVGKLWNLCNVLKDDGVTYHQYVTELTYLLFLKMAKETGQEQGIPEEWRWDALESLDGPKQMKHYQLLLLELGSSESGSSPLVQEIYSNASSFIKKPGHAHEISDRDRQARLVQRPPGGIGRSL